MQKIKIVIWDLDETFWHGTLSEDHLIRPRNECIEAVKTLTSRGIVNSIVSKNDFATAKRELQRIQMWEYFVFPSIAWKPKGPAIHSLLSQTKLRAENALFLDDNHYNLNEATHYNPGLNARHCDCIYNLLTDPSLQGKDDKLHTRLQQYKLLEKKAAYSDRYPDNAAFLRDSQITVTLLEGRDLFDQADRIVELLERANQLNFTKNRATQTELQALLRDDRYKSAAVQVSDRFGDYGVVGFYAYDNKTHFLKHFTFSCRILNLGIEQYLYASLQFPHLKIVPDVAVELTTTQPDWIALATNRPAATPPTRPASNKNTVFFKGGCDLSQMLFYLQDSGFSFEEETNYTAENNFPIHQEHTQVLIDSVELSPNVKSFAEEAHFIPFVDENFYRTALFKKNHVAVVYSLLMDYTNELYRSLTRDFTLPLGGYYGLWTEAETDADLAAAYEQRNIRLEKSVFTDFKKEFVHTGQISPESFKQNLRKIRRLLNNETPLILLNGAELPSPNPHEVAATSRHITMNKALDEFVAESCNVHLLDVRKIVDSPDMLTNSLRHYTRTAYKELAEELLRMLNRHAGLRVRETITMRTAIKELIRGSKVVGFYRKVKKTVLRK